MRGDRRAPMFVIAAALLGLIALLATLQYKWLGQISGAERERMTSTLNQRANGFAQDVDREVTRAYLLFQLDPMHPEQGPAAGLLARYDRWQATARYPRMIKDVYLVSPATPDHLAQIQRLNVSTRFLEPAEWPDALGDIRKVLARDLVAERAASPGPTFLFRAAVPMVWPAIPAIVVPSPMWMVTHTEVRSDGRSEQGRETASNTMNVAAEPRTTIVVFDKGYIDGEMLPALAQQHFQGTGDGFDYQVAVVSQSASAPLYRSVADFSPTADTPADAKVDLFQVRMKDFEPLVAEVSRFTTFTALASPGATARGTIIRGAVTATPHTNVTIKSAPMSIVLQSNNPGVDQQRADQLIAGAASSAGTRLTVRDTQPAWRLLVKHPSGSLEHAVNAARRRNLIVSSSILGILGISVGFLVVSTRRAQELARQQLEFVATVSHELRTPLAVIRSAADNLADGVVADEARIRQYGALVRREGVRLSDLVEQILEYAGLQSGQRRLAPQPVEVAGLLREVVAAAEPQARDTGVAIELSLGDNLPPVAGDESALRRVFQNLVGNAIKYGAGGGWIGIRASRSGGHVEVRVSDRGIGIAPGDQAKIFDPFYRAPGVVAAQIQGAGLGLSLVKRIVEAHSGRILLESAPGEGSTFIVVLPILTGDVADGREKISDAAPQHS